jgi:putative membrane protein
VRILLRWAVGAGALFLTVLLGQALGLKLALRDIGSAFVVVLALTLVNALVRPLVKLATLPLNCLTLGLFGFVVNALMFWLVGSLNLGLRVEGFWAALFGSVVLSFISGILNTVIPDGDEK